MYIIRSPIVEQFFVVQLCRDIIELQKIALQWVSVLYTLTYPPIKRGMPLTLVEIND